MTKHDFLTKLAAELKKRNVADSDDILAEYEQHFSFKLADGYAEEEIAAKLGAPEALAAQFESVPQNVPRHSAALTWLWLVWVDLFFGIFAVLLLSWGIVMAACVLSFGMTGVALVGNLGSFPLVSLPPMPYSSALLIGFALLALTAACCVGCIYFFGLIRQIFRSYGRFHQNALAGANSAPTLPPLPAVPQLAPSRRRKLRTVLVVSFICFGVFLVLGMALSAILAGSFEFWHVWGWFGYAG